MLKHENGLTNLSPDTCFEVYGLCFNQLEKVGFELTNFQFAEGLDFAINVHFIKDEKQENA